MSKVGILAYTSGRASGGTADKPSPDMSDAAVFEAFIEHGVPDTIIAVYDDNIAVSATIRLAAFTVTVNGHKVTVDGVSSSPMDLDHLEITFFPPAMHGDVITFQYDCRVDASFIDSNDNKPIDNALNAVQYRITAPVVAPTFAGQIGDLHPSEKTAFNRDVSSFFSSGYAPESYRLNNAPPGMTISKAGLIKWPSPRIGTTSGVSITATNAGGFAVSDAFNVIVDPTGHHSVVPPSLTGPTSTGPSEVAPPKGPPGSVLTGPSAGPSEVAPPAGPPGGTLLL